jgi:hypothetical protein
MNNGAAITGSDSRPSRLAGMLTALGAFAHGIGRFAPYCVLVWNSPIYNLSLICIEGMIGLTGSIIELSLPKVANCPRLATGLETREWTQP